jgi:hypothetical protein
MRSDEAQKVTLWMNVRFKQAAFRQSDSTGGVSFSGSQRKRSIQDISPCDHRPPGSPLLVLLNRFQAAITESQEDPWVLLPEIAVCLDDPQLCGDVWAEVAQTHFLDYFTNVEFPPGAFELLQTFLPSLCVILCAGEDDRGPNEPLGTFDKEHFLHYLGSYYEERQDDLIYCSLHFSVLANLARLEDCVLGPIFDCTISLSVSHPDLISSSLVEAAVNEIIAFHYPEGASRAPVSPDFVADFVQFATSPDPYLVLDGNSCDQLLMAVQLICRHYPELCEPLYLCNFMELGDVLGPLDSSPVLIAHMLGLVRALVRSRPEGTVWTEEHFSELSRAAGEESNHYFFDIYRCLIVNVPGRRAAYRDVDFWTSACRGAAGDASFTTRRKALKFLSALLDWVWSDAPPDVLHVLLRGSPDALISLLDGDDPLAVRPDLVVTIFDVFLRHDLLDPSSTPDSRFFDCLLDWDDRPVREDSARAEAQQSIVREMQARCGQWLLT